MSKARFINPFTDYGFNRLFGEEANKDLLIDFLNELLQEYTGKIKSLKYLENEHLAHSYLDRKAIFNLYCENEKGEKFIVRLQKTYQSYFKDRTFYYSTFSVQEQAKKDDWNYELKAVYTIGILDFEFEKQNSDYRHDVRLVDVKKKEVFYDKLTFIYLEMPKFKKNLEEIETRFDKWLYVIRNLNRLDNIPEALREGIFERFFETAEISKMNQDEIRGYESSLKYYQDIKNSLDSAERKKALEIAKNMKKAKMANEVIIQATGLSIEDIESL